jgi:hypothetical protein
VGVHERSQMAIYKDIERKKIALKERQAKEKVLK